MELKCSNRAVTQRYLWETSGDTSSRAVLSVLHRPTKYRSPSWEAVYQQDRPTGRPQYATADMKQVT
jgi:hypothetical protein